MKNKGFTIIEVLFSLVILAIIGLVISVGLNKLFNRSTEESALSFEERIISSTDLYLNNNQQLMVELEISKGYLLLQVNDLIENGYLNESVIDPSTNEKVLGITMIKVSLDAGGLLNIEYNPTIPDEAYLEGQSLLLEFKQDFKCDDISSYTSEWGSQSFRLIGKDGQKMNLQISNVIEDIECAVDTSKPGSYEIIYQYKIPELATVKRFDRTAIVSTDLNDIINLTAEAIPSTVIINGDLKFKVIGENRKGEKRELLTTEYRIGPHPTNEKGNFTAKITYNGENSDGTKPETTASYSVISNICLIVEQKGACTNEADGSCWFIGNQTTNYVNYLGKTWRIVNTNSPAGMRLILNDTTGSNYAFTFNRDVYNCRPKTCCNSVNQLGRVESKYLLTQNPNGLFDHLKNYLNNLNGNKSYISQSTYNISKYNSSNRVMTSQVGLLSYEEYQKVARCSTFSCSSSYLNISKTWGLGTYYALNIRYSKQYNISTSRLLFIVPLYARRYYPYYHQSLYVNTSGGVSIAGGSWSLQATDNRQLRTIKTGSGTSLGVRPVITLNCDTQFTGGSGSSSDPYRIE